MISRGLRFIGTRVQPVISRGLRFIGTSESLTDSETRIHANVRRGARGKESTTSCEAASRSEIVVERLIPSLNVRLVEQPVGTCNCSFNTYLKYF